MTAWMHVLAGSRFLSALDLAASGYWQDPFDGDAREKSAFTTRYGPYQWKTLPSGVMPAPATFQRLMEKVLKILHWHTLLLYLDDIIVVAKDFNGHLLRLGEVLTRKKTAGLKLKPSKCKILKE